MNQKVMEKKTIRMNKKNLPLELLLTGFITLLLIFIGFFEPGFFSLNNMMGILNYFSYIVIAAIGMNLVIITGNIDVSAGAIISVISICIAFLAKLGMPIYVFMPAGMIVGMILTFINSLFITKLRIPPIVATLATTQLFAGILPVLVEGAIYELPPAFTWLNFKAKLFGFIPASALFMIIIVFAALLFMKYSRFAKKLYAIGNSESASRLAGINVKRTIMSCFCISGLLYGITATLIATAGERVTTGIGSGLEMTFISAVILGGTNIAGGSGKVMGTVLGAFILSLIWPAMNYLGFPPDWSDAVKGAIILCTILVAQISKMRSGKKTMIVDAGRDKGVNA